MLKGAFGGGNENTVNNGEMTVDEKSYVWGKRAAKLCNFGGLLLFLCLVYKGIEAIYYGKSFTFFEAIASFLLLGFFWLLGKVFFVKFVVGLTRWVEGVKANIKM